MRMITRAAATTGGAPSAAEITQRFTAQQLSAHTREVTPGERVAAHYHPVDEHLVVVRGAMTFIDLTTRTAPITITAGEGLSIPEGTVHAVTGGDEGAQYVMGLSRPIPLAEFRIPVVGNDVVPVDALVALIEANFRMAEVEETPALDETFFKELLSDRFVFVGALGNVSMTKPQFVEGLKKRAARGRVSTSLRLRCEGKAVLASLVVTTKTDGREFLNARLFELEAGGHWRCVRWANTEVSSSPVL